MWNHRKYINREFACNYGRLDTQTVTIGRCMIDLGLYYTYRSPAIEHREYTTSTPTPIVWIELTYISQKQCTYYTRVKSRKSANVFASPDRNTGPPRRRRRRRRLCYIISRCIADGHHFPLIGFTAVLACLLDARSTHTRNQHRNTNYAWFALLWFQTPRTPMHHIPITIIPKHIASLVTHGQLNE